MYQVLARKWRPQTFAQLVGQPHVSRTLGNAIEQDRLAHAYIFAGLRGTGKTTVARILAKCLNCEKGPTTTPCNECAPCTEIAESRAIDVLEIDAASRTKVEQTRELLEVVSYAPVRDRYKILIIDEAHMLSKASFNALLKTLEEPPPNVVFLLATTELPKILPTIHSRCQVFEFRRVAPTEVAAHLRRICDDEKIDIPDAALERLARSGEGSVRDSLSLLERAVAFCGTKIEDEEVLRMLGAVRAKVLSEMIGALARRDAAAMLGVLDGLVDEGHDLIHFWNVMIAAARDLLVERTLPDRKDLLARPPEEAEELIRAAKGLTREDLIRVFQVLADLEPALKSSGQPRFLFEAALIRLASLGAVRPIEEVLQSLEAPATAPRPPASRQKKKPGEPPEVSPGERARTVRPAPPPTPEARPGGPAPEAPPATGDAARLAEAVRQARPMLAAMLEQSTVEVSSGHWVIRFPAGLEAVKRQVEARQSLALLRREAERLAGGRVAIRVEVGAPEAAAPVTSPATTPRRESSPGAPEAAPARRDPAPRPAREDPTGLLERAQSEPGIKKLMETFGAQVVDIRRCESPSKPRRPTRADRRPEDSP
jgi:DNA polymerase-3 subunit gamma/tau